MNKLDNIPETCPIYKEAEHLFDCLKEEVEQARSNKEITEYLAERITDYSASILGCVDRCRDISGELRKMCFDRGNKIEQLEEELEEVR